MTAFQLLIIYLFMHEQNQFPSAHDSQPRKLKVELAVATLMLKKSLQQRTNARAHFDTQTVLS
jgi:hypothetical protein